MKSFQDTRARSSKPTTRLRERAEKPTVRNYEKTVSAADAITPRLQVFTISLDSVPRSLRRPDDIMGLPLDPKAAFLLMNIDGLLNVQTLIDVTGMPERVVIPLLAKLLELHVIAVS